MRTLATIIFSALYTISFSQTEIVGQVSDEQGRPIAFANIMLKDTYDGASSDENGNFIFETDEKGSHILVVKFLGFKDFKKEIILENRVVSLKIILEEHINELNAVTISAGTFGASDESRRTIFRALDIATTAGATADIAGALNTLPGTQKVGESGRLFVRGGDGNETRTFIDGMVVLDAYSPAAPNAPSRGRFLPFMFKGTSFSTGGYSAEFGQALSSVLALNSKDESAITRTDIGILSVGSDITHTQAWKGGSASGKIQYTNLRPYVGLISQEIDWKTPPASVEGIAAFRQRVGKQGMVKVYGNFSRSDFSLYNHNIDDYAKTQLYDRVNDYGYLNGFYKNALGQKWMIRSGLSYTFLQDNVAFDQSPITETEKGVHAKTAIEGSLSDHVELKSGVEVINRTYTHKVAIANQQSLNSGFHETISSLFTEADIYASNKFVTRLGVRAEHNNLVNRVMVDPRISLAYKAGSDGQFSLAYGRFRQSPKNEFVRQDQNVDQEKAEHFILNYQYVKDRKTFRIEAYHKRYLDLIKFDHNNVIANTGSGYARGIELFWRDNQSLDNLDYWVSYSFLDTERDYLNFPNSAVPSFASRHNFSVVTKYFVAKLKSQLGTTWSFTSGRPYNNPNEELFNNSRTPAYQDLSFNWSYLPKPYLIIYFSCTNLLGKENIFGYEYSATANDNGIYNSRPIRQAAPRFLFLGIFITLSKDKSVSQLPTL